MPHRNDAVFLLRWDNGFMTDTRAILKRLERSKFRSSFHLKQKDIDYIHAKGMDTIMDHCDDFIRERLAPSNLPNDGKQTPMKGHPVFVAQHACGCCCRGCLRKWYRVPEHTELSAVQQEKIVNLLMAWIEKEYAETKKSVG